MGHLRRPGRLPLTRGRSGRDKKLTSARRQSARLDDRKDNVVIYDVSAPGARGRDAEASRYQGYTKFAAVGGVAFSPTAARWPSESPTARSCSGWRRGPEAVPLLEGHAGAVVALAFGASDRELVSIDSFGRIISWSDGRGEASPAAPPNLKQEWSAHATDSEAKDVVGDYGVSRAAFSGDGKTLILRGNRE